MRIIVLFLSVLLLPFTPALAGKVVTKNISGKVIDKETLKPLSGVCILYADDSRSIGTITNIDGEFRMWNLPDLNKELVISFDGYRSLTVHLDEIEDFSEQLIIELQEDEKDMKAVSINQRKKIKQ
ncbi:carboxypeptidase-like regulatory domain-containing protein [Gaoshiqia sp. Z1-71]|uniref:carboxypeptidase-like regulatory domain-containing protein n=1 Tax=Gaoshiqia hydrogeniformans TaxID=3290090 RepID=UPI003BF91578